MIIDNKNKYRVCVIIPARGGSKRLKYKNIYPVMKKPMICWSIDACKNSKYVDFVCVSTEDLKIEKTVQEYSEDIVIHKRELKDSGDKVFKMVPIRNAYKTIQEKYGSYDIVISLQANSPQITGKIIDDAIETFLKNDRNELISVNNNLMQNAAFRIMREHTVFQRELSTKCGFFVCELIDVHTIEDVHLIEQQMRS
tara:strand:- start:23 stop:613 length:591 start_codon:yes stop_codon:yes gene_type:complete